MKSSLAETHRHGIGDPCPLQGGSFRPETRRLVGGLAQGRIAPAALSSDEPERSSNHWGSMAEGTSPVGTVQRRAPSAPPLP